MVPLRKKVLKYATPKPSYSEVLDKYQGFRVEGLGFGTNCKGILLPTMQIPTSANRMEPRGSRDSRRDTTKTCTYRGLKN